MRHRSSLVPGLLVCLLSACAASPGPAPGAAPDLAAPGSDTAPDAAPEGDLAQGLDFRPSGDGPRILSLGANVTQLTSGETVRFVAVVTDPAGLAQLVGGQLVSQDGAIKYGAFQADQQGSYSLDLTWAQINQARSIDFAAEEQRTFIAEFFNAAGRKTAQPLRIRLHCGGLGACAGVCLAPGGTCGAGKVCVAGMCSAGCYIGGALRPPDAVSPDSVCQVCAPAVSTSRYANLPDDQLCGGGQRCAAGKCLLKFVLVAGSTGSLNRLWGSGPMDIWAVGDSSLIVHSGDGGVTWTESRPPFGDDFRGVWGSGPADVYFVGDNNRAFRTVNGGASFTRLNTGYTTDLTAVWGSGAGDVYFVGALGRIFRTVNSGASFTRQSTPVTVTLRAVAGTGANNVIAVGDAGVILRTTDSGTTWTQVPSGTTQDLLCLTSVAGVLYACGAANSVLRSTDGGGTWTALPTGIAGGVKDLFGTGANNLFFTTNSSVYRSVNGGMSWVAQNRPIWTATTVWGSGATDIYVGGSNITRVY